MTSPARPSPGDAVAAAARIDAAFSHGYKSDPGAELVASDWRTVLEYARQASDDVGGSVGLDRRGPCAMCGQAFSPAHDCDAPGATVRHPFTPAVRRDARVTQD